ncbi:MAG: hypothetical protein H7211_17125, partial [Aquabacterium sp.]|nr:hypothetical protein [Ferruginibacter sp.]
MALEMVDDPQDNEDNGGSGSGGSGFGSSGGGGGFGGLGGLFNFLPLIFGLFGNRNSGGNSGGGGKGGCGGSSLIIILVIAAGAYFLFRNQSCTGGLSTITNAVSQFTRGGKLDPNEFKKASVYEGLEDDNTKNPLPESVSLLKFAPDRQNQGKQGSCVAWSSGYAARSII